MQIEIELGTIITICSLAVSATVWIGRQLGGIRKEIQAFHDVFVTNERCLERRQYCPCVSHLVKLEKEIEKEKKI